MNAANGVVGFAVECLNRPGGAVTRTPPWSTYPLENSSYLAATILPSSFAYAPFRGDFAGATERDRTHAYLVLEICSASRRTNGGTSVDFKTWRWHDAAVLRDRAPRQQRELETSTQKLEGRDEAEEAEVAVPPHTRRKRGRTPLPEWIPRVELLHDLPEAQKRCPADGRALERIGEESAEQLEFVPARLRVLRHVRPKYACPACREGIHTAAVPPQPIPKSLASPTLLAHGATSKYADGLPLYRQEAMFTRLGIDLTRASLASWMVKAGELVQPLVNLLRDDLLASGGALPAEVRRAPEGPGRDEAGLGFVQKLYKIERQLGDAPRRSAIGSGRSAPSR